MIRHFQGELGALRTALLAALLGSAIALGCGGPAPELTPEQIVAAFIAATSDDARTFHMEWQGAMGTDQTFGEGQPPMHVTSTLVGSFDFSGADYAGTMTTSVGMPGDPTNPFDSTVGYARIGGVAFTQYPGSGWQRSDEFGAPAPPGLDPFAGLTEDDVAYEELDTVDGLAVHRLRVPDLASALARALFPDTGPITYELKPGEPQDFLVYVDGAGIPVAARVNATIQTSFEVDVDGPAPADTALTLTFEYRFSDWGADITIVPPRV